MLCNCYTVRGTLILTTLEYYWEKNTIIVEVKLAVLSQLHNISKNDFKIKRSTHYSTELLYSKYLSLNSLSDILQQLHWWPSESYVHSRDSLFVYTSIQMFNVFPSLTPSLSIALSRSLSLSLLNSHCVMFIIILIIFFWRSKFNRLK